MLFFNGRYQPLTLASMFKLLIAVFCLHHGPGPPTRQFCKMVLPAFDLLTQAGGFAHLLLGVMDWIKKIY